MNTKERIDIEPKDGFLLYEIIQIIHGARSEDRKRISVHRIYKVLSSILRQMEFFIKNVPGYNGYHQMELKHGPFRFGEVIYSSWSPDGGYKRPNKYEVHFLKDIVANDKVVSFFGKVVDDIEDDRNSTIAFKTLTSDIYKVVYKRIGIQIEDIVFVQNLARLYSYLPGKHIESFSTCPTIEDTIMAILAEFKVWSLDVKQLIEILDHAIAYSLEVEEDLNKVIGDMAAASSQVYTKKDWLDRIPSLMPEFRSAAKNAGFDEDDLDFFINSFPKNTSSSHIDHILGCANILGVFVRYTLWCLLNMGVNVALSEDQELELGGVVPQTIIAPLRSIGVTSEELNYGAFVMKSAHLTELSKHFKNIFETIQEYFEDNGLFVNVSPHNLLH